MNHENDYDDENFDVDYESDFEEVEVIDDYNDEKVKNPQPETKTRYQHKNYIEEHDITDKSIEYIHTIKKPEIKNSKESHESEEFYEDSFQDSEYEISQKKEPEPKKPDTQYNFDILQRKKESIKAENPFKKDYEIFLSKKPDSKEFTDRNDSKQHLPIKTSQSPILSSKAEKSIIVRTKTPNNLRSLENSKRNISPKISIKILNNLTLDKIKAKPDFIRKTRQILEKENIRLRDDLKTLNEQISQFLEITTLEAKNKLKKIVIDNKSNGESNIDKRLKIYESEYNMIKDKYNKINDPKHLSFVKEDIKSKEKKIIELEKVVKTLEKNQSAMNKKIEEFDDKFVTDDKNSYQQLQDEYYAIEQQIKDIENCMIKEKEWYNNKCLKEAELQSKYDKLMILSENYQSDYVDEKLNNKFSSLSNMLANIGKIRNNTKTQFKIQEKTVRVKKESLQKEVNLLKNQIQDRTQELKKIRDELENLLEIASANNMTRLVSIVNFTKMPELERSLSSRSGSELRGSKKFSRNNNQNSQKLPRNLSSNPKNSEYINEVKKYFPLQKSSEKSYNTKPFDIISPEPKNRQDFQKSKPQPKPIDSYEIDEEIEDFSNKKILPKELENENLPLLQKNPHQPIKNQDKNSNYLEKIKKEQAKNFLFQELESSSKLQEKKDKSPKKSSLFDELEHDNKQNLYTKTDIQPKPSMITELDYNNKSGLFKNHESNYKLSIFQELEQNNKIETNFKPVINEKKPSIFDELEERDLGLENEKSGWKAPENKRLIFEELESNGMENKAFKPISGGFEVKNNWNDSGDKDYAKRFSIFREENSQKVDIFEKSELPDPSVKRNRSHLLKKNDDKVAVLTENAAKNNLFGNIFDPHEPEKLNYNAQSKLLPIIRDHTPDKINIKIDEAKFRHFETKKHDPKKETKNTKNFQLEEEDLLL
ncbi:hypothetical protein SteCoe_12535 [Stentor coeruleus]|uniref:Uncharacterized protein n=1 Tax=Stentor coeruleus TaxID=5963 RepID=A0A1R2CAL2_9CILI|nr:hypothetical protein SteCoe_12535 [Stentor coeruleus]